MNSSKNRPNLHKYYQVMAILGTIGGIIWRGQLAWDVEDYGLDGFGRMETTHVQHRLPGARGNPSGGGGGGGGRGSGGGGGSGRSADWDEEDDRWDDVKSIAGSIFSHCDTECYGDFVPEDIATIASNVLADRYYDADHDEILEMLDWYDDNFDGDGEPIDDDDEGDGDGLCTHCEKNQAAWDCCYDECGKCCDEGDCERHGWD